MTVYLLVDLEAIMYHEHTVQQEFLLSQRRFLEKVHVPETIISASLDYC